MNTALVVIAIILIVVGIVGSIVPMLPGPPLAWAGLLLASMASTSQIGWVALLVAAALCVAVTLIDLFLPSKLTKRFGGGKAGFWGCNIGLILSFIGVPFGPQGLIGVVFWPFVGAFVAEAISQRQLAPAAKSAFGSFVGFLSGTILKVVYCLSVLIYVIADLF